MSHEEESFWDCLGRIEFKLDFIIKGLAIMSSQVSQNFLDLQAEVTADGTVESSAITLLNGLSEQLAAAIAANTDGDTAALPNLLSQLTTSSSALAAAVTANTIPPVVPVAGIPGVATPQTAGLPPQSQDALKHQALAAAKK